MNELMTHVERIVRPVRASASRKLRMRQELLAHLQQAVEDEQSAGLDAAASVQGATRRLGEPGELTRSLQQSVPWIERVLMSKIPAPPTLSRRAERFTRWWKFDHPMTVTHALILFLSSTLLPLLALEFLGLTLRLDRAQVLRHVADDPIGLSVLNAATAIIAIALIIICSRFSAALALSGKRLRPMAAARYAVTIIILPALALFGTLIWMHRHPAFRDFALGLGTGVVLLGLLATGARLVKRLGHPYIEWLAIEIAE